LFPRAFSGSGQPARLPVNVVLSLAFEFSSILAFFRKSFLMRDGRLFRMTDL
jgi:hypothetical protein